MGLRPEPDRAGLRVVMIRPLLHAFDLHTLQMSEIEEMAGEFRARSGQVRPVARMRPEACS